MAKDMNKHFSKEHTDGQPTHEKMLNISHHQGNTNQTTIRYHLTPVRMANINNSGNNRCWQGCGERGSFFALLVGMHAGAATLENSMEVPQNTKNRTTLRPSNCTIRHLSTGYRYAVLKGRMYPNVYSSIIHNSQSMERAQMSIN